MLFRSYEDPKGLRDYTQSKLTSYDELTKLGQAHHEQHPQFFEAEALKAQPDDTSIILYTSGTTGKPKGVEQTHGSFLGSGKFATSFDNLTDKEDLLAYLPMAWVGDHLFAIAEAMAAGYTVNCPESKETVMADMREIGPTFYFAPPRIYEGLLTQVMIRMEDAGYIKRKMFDMAMDLAKRVGSEILDGHSVGLIDRIKYAIGNITVYGPLRNVLGMNRVRVAYTAEIGRAHV